MSSNSMLPVSGAAQLIASGAISGDHPVISAKVAYSVTVKPWWGSWLCGKNKFHKPWALAFAFNSSTIGGKP